MSNKDWKDKRIDEINKIIKNEYDHEYYIQEYCKIINSKAKSYEQYKKESESKCLV
tara:strand:- start:74 stop:241 length:168 start_codon:yes stop_codon:yes gene_type:complete